MRGDGTWVSVVRHDMTLLSPSTSTCLVLCRGVVVVALGGVLGCAGGDPSPPDSPGSPTPIDSGSTSTASTGTLESAAPTADSGTPSPTGVPVEVVASDPIVCTDPSQRAAAPFDVIRSREEREKKNWFWGAGAIVGHFDADAHLDVLLPGFWETYLYRGQPADLFDDHTDDLAGLPLAGAAGGSTADYDGDGDMDVLVTRFLAPDVLLRNDGGQFVDVSEAAGIQRESKRSIASSWGDIDADGDLDLFVGGYGVIDQSREDPDHANFDPGDPAALYLNNGDGTFTDVSDRLPAEAHDGLTFTGGFVDVDLDGALDLYIVNDFGNSFPNVLLRNQGDGTFLLHPEAGLDIAMTGMGVAIGDLNGDLFPDFAMGAWNGNHLLKSTAVGWVDYTDAVGFVNDLDRTQKIGWGVEFHDLDNDGDLDMPMVYGHLDATYESSERQPDAMYLQHADGTFEDVGQDWGFNHPTVGRGFVVADLDDNGWLDVVKRDLAGPSLVYVAKCGEAHWLRVRLHQGGMNRFAVGARVEFEVAGDSALRSRTVLAGSAGHASGPPPEVHVGLGDAAATTVRVVWPDGEVSVLPNVAADRILDIHRL